MTAQPTKSLQRADTGERSRLAVEIQGLSKSFGRTKALDGLDLTVAPGEITGFLGPERRGQVHHAPRAAGPVARRRWHSATARRRPLARRRGVAPPYRLRAGGCDAVAEPDRPAGHRLSRRDSRQRNRHESQGSADRAVRTRPAQEGADILQGQPAEGGDRRRLLDRCRALHSRRADGGPGPVDGEGVSALCRGGLRPWRGGVVVQPHPGRGREALRQRHDHPRWPCRALGLTVRSCNT